MVWTLFIVIAFATGGGYHNGGQGGLTSETLDFKSKEACEAAGKEIKEFYKTDGGLQVDTIITSPTSRKLYERRADVGKDWMASTLNIQYTCIERKLTR